MREIPESTLLRVVVIGVAGSGKSTVGALLAQRLGVDFLDGDTLHPPENVAKLAAGVALDDTDRLPWLDALRQRLAEADGLVIACSALRRAYRDLLRRAGDVRFVFLDIDKSLAFERLSVRRGHFMGADMVGGQFDTLERPEPGERDVVSLAADAPPDVLVRRAAAALRSDLHESE